MSPMLWFFTGYLAFPITLFLALWLVRKLVYVEKNAPPFRER